MTWWTVSGARALVAYYESVAEEVMLEALTQPNHPTIPDIRPAKPIPRADPDEVEICKIFARLNYLISYLQCMISSDPKECEAVAYEAYCEAHNACASA